MPQIGAFLRESLEQLGREIREETEALRRHGPDQLRLWALAAVVGAVSALAALAFRFAISWTQRQIYGSDDVHLASLARGLPWPIVLLAPTLGGLVVGLLLHALTRDGRPHTPADLIAAAELEGARLPVREGIASILASWITLSSGGSSGREGPVVHFSGVISTILSDLFRLDAARARILLGAASAAAVAASFNAPLAGAIFAHEVVLRHYAIRSFGPVAIAAVIGAVASRLVFGEFTEFVLPGAPMLAFYVELPAFLLLGLVIALAATAFMRGIFWADDLGDRLQAGFGFPRWLRPALAGAVLGTLALGFPHVIGVGYETTARALTGALPFWTAVIYALVKAVAVAVTLGGRMGGGVFSPSLMLGALTGLAFGEAATAILPFWSGNVTLYALAGMGAFAAAVLGAPVSSALIVFELTGDWQTGLAVLLTVATASALSSRLVERSFFLTLLERKGIHIAAGPHAWILAALRVQDLMRPLDDPENPDREVLWKLVEYGIHATAQSSLETVMPIFEKSGTLHVPVVRLGGEGEAPEIVGVLHKVDALSRYNAALAEKSAEEHG